MSEIAHGVVPVFTAGDRLRKARELTGLDQTEFAEAIGISRGSVSNYERADHAPRRIVLQAWALATGVPAEWLEKGTGPTSSPDPGTPRGLPSAEERARRADELAARNRRTRRSAATPEYVTSAA